MDAFLGILFQFYGLDWLAMALGLTGTYYVSNQNKLGFLYNSVACAFGLAVAVLSGQMGFIVYNGILIALMVRGFMTWGRAGTPA